MDIFEAFGRYESHIPYMHDTHAIRVFENFKVKNKKKRFSWKLFTFPTCDLSEIADL